MLLSAKLFIVFIMLILNAVFAAYEMALASVSRVRLSLLAQQKRKGAAEAIFMKDRIEASLAVIQLGITFFGVIAAAMGGAEAVASLKPHLIQRFSISTTLAEGLALFFIILPLSGLTIVFAELVPKAFALKNKEWVCLKLSPALKKLSVLSYPLVIFFEKTVRKISSLGTKRLKKRHQEETQEGIHELRAAASVARTLRLIGARQEKIVHAATELSTRPVDEIMIPNQDISMIPVGFSLSESLIRAHMDMHTRFPVCEDEGNPQTIIGYVNFKDIIFALNVNPANPTLRGISRSIKRVKSQTPIFAVLEEMIQEVAHIALVQDVQKKVLGMVTMEDLLEELVGDIKDEYDHLPNYIQPYLEGWVIGGGALVSLVSAKIGVLLVEVPSVGGKAMTFAEWCLQARGGEPFKGGESIEHQGLTITVKKLRRRQIAEAIVLRASVHA